MSKACWRTIIMNEFMSIHPCMCWVYAAGSSTIPMHGKRRPGSWVQLFVAWKWGPLLGAGGSDACGFFGFRAFAFAFVFVGGSWFFVGFWQQVDDVGQAGFVDISVQLVGDPARRGFFVTQVYIEQKLLHKEVAKTITCQSMGTHNEKKRAKQEERGEHSSWAKEREIGVSLL